MKKYAATACLVLFLTGLNLPSADQPADFSGKWIPDLKKSDLVAKNIMGPGNSGVSDPSMGGGMGGGFGGPGGGFGGPGGGFGGPGGGGPNAKQPTPQTLPPITIEQTPTSMTITTAMIVNGIEGAPYVESYPLDSQKDIIEKGVNPYTQKEEKKQIKISLKKNKFQVRTITEGQYGNTETKKTFQLSKDGKTLKMEMLNDMGFFQTLQEIVYTKE